MEKYLKFCHTERSEVSIKLKAQFYALKAWIFRYTENKLRNAKYRF